MAGNEINGNTAAMTAFSTRLQAPPPPASMARLGSMPNLTGTFEGIAMTLLDKAATAEINAFMVKMTQDIVRISTDAKEIATMYSAADVATALDLAASTAKLATQGIGLVKKFAGQAQQSGGSSDTSARTKA
ncbi:hypothetical protein [Amycolatopsis sp.]|uniref:hypothetical protein n=1 Tax=Amycolatopsis sp. TaxID=37632 RepID=UPI002C30B8D0|nr:hypothetical protein [Amycolatopsis sp.]HVV09005.1 hypothetical protein [Amycolatopsis sp.]